MGKIIAEVTTSVPKCLIAKAADLIIYLKRTPSGRQIDEILTVPGLRNETYITIGKQVPWRLIESR